MTDPTPTRDEAPSTREMAIHVLRIAIEDRRSFDTVEMNVGDLSMMLGLLLASAPSPASGRVDAVAAIIAKWVDEKRFADAPAFRMAAREIIASLSPAATPVSEAGRKEKHHLDGGLSCEFDGDCYMLTWTDGYWLTAKADGSVVTGRSPSAEWHQPARKTSVAALAKPASSPAGGDVHSDLVKRLNALVARPGRDWRTGDEFIHGVHSQDIVDIIREAAAALSQSTSAGRVGE